MRWLETENASQGRFVSRKNREGIRGVTTQKERTVQAEVSWR